MCLSTLTNINDQLHVHSLHGYLQPGYAERQNSRLSMFKGSDTGLYEETICGKNEREIEPVYRHRTGPYLFTFIGSQCLETSYSHSLYVMYGLHLLFCRGKVVGFWRLHQMVIQETRQNKHLLTADKDCVMAFFTSSFIVCLNKPSIKSIFSKRGVCYGSSSHY